MMKRNISAYSLLLLTLLLPAVLQASNYVIINQVMYDTPLNEQVDHSPYSNGEFIELYNGSNVPVSMHGWRLTGDGSTELFLFPDTSIAPKGFLVIAYRHFDTPSYSFYDEYPSFQASNIPVLYQNTVVLSNSGENIDLYNSEYEIVDHIYYDGNTHLSKPDRLSADNPDSIPGSQCVSLHRTWVEFSETGRTINNTSLWKTDLVTCGLCHLAETEFYEHNLVNPQLSQTGHNYILSVTPLDPASRVSVANDGVSVSSGIRAHTSIQYYDGLGRPTEQIALEATPGRKDLATLTCYSGLHRATQQWSPVPIQTEGQYIDCASLQAQAQAYYDNDDRPFVETLYENSELERIIGYKRQGLTYEGHPSANTYSINEESDNVRIYTVVNDSILKTTGENYAAHTLYKTIVSDEDGVSVTTYTDKLGVKVAEERAGNKTYFVYDDLRRLRYVLPNIPNGKLNNGEYPLSNPTLRAAAYYYSYDNRGNIIYKRLPGCQPQYMVYDMTGQLVLKQDGNLRVKDTWTMYAYDSIGRNLYSAEIILSQTHEELVAFFADKWQVEHYGNNYSFPIAGTGYASRLLKNNHITMLTINYYDNYKYLNILPTPIRQAIRYEQKSGYGLKYDNATGLLTGTRVYNLSEEGYTATAYYYDKKGRVVQSRSVRNNGSDKAVTTTEYLFDGSVAQQLIQHEADSTLVEEHYHYTYDHVGRLKETKYQLNDDPEITLSAFSYDSIGRLAQNLLHNNTDTIRYSYDIRNMLTAMHNRHFSEDLYYADIPSGALPNPNVTKCYNGNISAMTIGNEEDGFYSFLNTYDAQNRLTESYTQASTFGQGERFSYDAAGNIISLQRHTNNHVFDNLTFYYGNEGNQLYSITDQGYADLYDVIEYQTCPNPSDSPMRYDANGNLVYDEDRGITKITYNYLNLPDTILFKKGHMIVNCYDANGTKYKFYNYTNFATVIPDNYDYSLSVSSDSANYIVKEYHGNVIKTRTVNKEKGTDYDRVMVRNAIGYNEDSAYYHYVKNHLGSNSAVVRSENDEQVQSTIIIPAVYRCESVLTVTNNHICMETRSLSRHTG